MARERAGDHEPDRGVGPGLARDEVGREIGRQPPRAQRRRVGADGLERVAQRGALAQEDGGGVQA
jgi:hypothetical protein